MSREATVEISMYPLKDDYEPSIIDFIHRLEAYEGFQVRVNETSTHLFGEYNRIFDALKAEIARTFDVHGKAVFVLKILGMNLQVMQEGLTFDEAG